VDEPLDPLDDLSEGAERREASDLDLDLLARHGDRLGLLPGVLGQLLEAERGFALLRLDVEDDDLFLGPDLEERLQIRIALAPRHVADVQEAVDAGHQLHEDAEVGDARDLGRDLVARAVLLGELLPGIGHQLLHAQRDPSLFGVDVEHLDDHFLTRLHLLTRVIDALGPRHLGVVDQPLHAGLDLDERAEAGEIDDLALDGVALGNPVGDALPRIAFELFGSEPDALSLRVPVEHFDLDLLADVELLLGMVDAGPAHVRGVEQTLEPANVDERAVGHQSPHHALVDLAGLELLGQLLGLLLESGLEDLATAQDHVASTPVDFHDLELLALADVRREVVDLVDVDLARRHEPPQADVDHEPAVVVRDHFALDRLSDPRLPMDLVPEVEGAGLPP